MIRVTEAIVRQQRAQRRMIPGTLGGRSSSALPAPPAARHRDIPQRGGAVVGCKVFQTGGQLAGQSIPHDTDTPILFDSETADPNGMHSTSSNTDRLIVPDGYAGWWSIKTVLQFNSNSTGRRVAKIFVNAVQQASKFMPAISSTYGDTTVDCFADLILDDGDLIQIIGAQDSGGGSLRVNATEGSVWASALFLGRAG